MLPYLTYSAYFPSYLPDIYRHPLWKLQSSSNPTSWGSCCLFGDLSMKVEENQNKTFKFSGQNVMPMVGWSTRKILGKIRNFITWKSKYEEYMFYFAKLWRHIFMSTLLIGCELLKRHLGNLFMAVSYSQGDPYMQCGQQIPVYICCHWCINSALLSLCFKRWILCSPYLGIDSICYIWPRIARGKTNSAYKLE